LLRKSVTFSFWKVGNLIVKLPFQRFHVLTVVPSLIRLDGNEIKKADRSIATPRRAFDNGRQTQLCLQDIKLARLRVLSTDTDPRDMQWLSEVQAVLGSDTLESLGLIASDITSHFDQMRDVAHDFREKRPSEHLSTWASVYSSIESAQKGALDDLVSQIQCRVQRIRVSHPTTPTPNKFSPSRSASRELVLTSPSHTSATQTPPTPHVPQSGALSPIISPLEFDLPAVAVRLGEHHMLARVLSAWSSLVQPAPVGPSEIFAAQRARTRAARWFYLWKC
jgi:hypothetical protein